MAGSLRDFQEELQERLGGLLEFFLAFKVSIRWNTGHPSIAMVIQKLIFIWLIITVPIRTFGGIIHTV